MENTNDHSGDALRYLLSYSLGFRKVTMVYVSNETDVKVYLLNRPVFKQMLLCLN